MTVIGRSLSRIAPALVGAFVWVMPAAACQVCFGDPNSSLTRGVEAGVWFLLAVIILVEAAFGIFFFVYLRRRARGIRAPMSRPVLRVVKNGV